MRRSAKVIAFDVGYATGGLGWPSRQLPVVPLVVASGCQRLPLAACRLPPAACRLPARHEREGAFTLVAQGEDTIPFGGASTYRLEPARPCPGFLLGSRKSPVRQTL